MKKAVLTAAGLLVLAGCATYHEAPYTDPRFGEASRQSWDRQVVYPEGLYPDTLPEGMGGLHAEKVMNTYNQNYDRKHKAPDVMQIGLTGGASKK